MGGAGRLLAGLGGGVKVGSESGEGTLGGFTLSGRCRKGRVDDLMFELW